MKKRSKIDFKAFKAGYEHAFKIVFDQYHHIILQHAIGFCHNLEEAEEIAQDTFIQLFLYKEKIDNEEGILPFLYTVSKRSAISHFRRKIVREQVLYHSSNISQTNFYDTEQVVIAKELENNIDNIIEELPHQQKKVFVLNKLENLSYQEIAERLSVSKNTVRNHLAMATKTVRVKLHKLMYFFI